MNVTGQMLLAIDAGNTRIKWGIHDGESWRRTGFVGTAKSTELLLQLNSVPSRIIVSNVAGAAVEANLLAQLSDTANSIHVIRSLPDQCGVHNSYRSPGQLGTDRWAAIIGAHSLGPGAKIVVVAGTAMTVDALTAEGRFLGGVIVPGHELMQNALRANTAQLGVPQGTWDEFPKETADAITSGAIQASVGAVIRLRDALRREIGGDPGCVLSGGGAPLLAPHLPFPALIQDNLVLDGLAVIAMDIFR